MKRKKRGKLAQAGAKRRKLRSCSGERYKNVKRANQSNTFSLNALHIMVLLVIFLFTIGLVLKHPPITGLAISENPDQQLKLNQKAVFGINNIANGIANDDDRL